jgi:hypothetical protein
VLPTDYEIEFIAEKPVVRVTHNVQPKRREGGNQGNSKAVTRLRIHGLKHETNSTVIQHRSRVEFGHTLPVNYHAAAKLRHRLEQL